ncbi:MAG: S53 family peptidase [Actinomycetes bacterium]
MRRTQSLTVLAAAAVGAAMLGQSPAGPASATIATSTATPPPSAPTPRSAAEVLTPSNRELRIADPNERITFYWGLKRDDAGAARRVVAASTPGNPAYRNFLTPAGVAARFGATQTTVTTVKKYLQSKKLSARLDKSRIFLRVDGTAAAFTAAFGQPIESGPVGDFVGFGPFNAPTLPPRIHRLVPEAIWFYERQPTLPGKSLAADSPRTTPRADFPENQGTMTGCSALTSLPFAPILLTVEQLSKAYGIASLPRPKAATARGDVVSHPPIGILALGSGFTDEFLRSTKACFGVGGSVYRIETDGMVRPLASGGEGNLDVQVVISALAAGYRVPVFESGGVDDLGFLAPVAALNSVGVPRVLTTSYGTCEVEYPKAGRKLSDAVFMRLGLVGTSVLAASGDSGSSGCVDQDTGQGPRQLAVEYPASSPWVTGVGGTRIVFTKGNNRAAEFAWNDQPWSNTGGGGGTSNVYRRPAWQRSQAVGGSRRSVPDLSAHASDFPGYPLVGISLPTFFAVPVSGTSAATPLTASGFALLNASLEAKGQPPLGLLNPWLYQLPRKATFDITIGNTDVYGVGCCTARRGYDQATGIGSPNFASIRKAVRPAG